MRDVTFFVFLCKISNILKSEIKFLEAGKLLFFSLGIKKVTVEDVCLDAGLSKMTFYRLFGNKEAFVLRFFEFIYEDGMAKFKKILNGADDFNEKIVQLMLLEIESAKSYSKRFFQEMSDWLEREDLQKYIQESSDMMRQFFKQGQLDGDVNPDLNIDLMLYLVKDWQLKAFDPEISGLYESHELMIRDLTQMFYFGIIGKK